jgi:hypothetical protein
MWLAPVPFRPHVERAGTLIPGGGTPSMSGVTLWPKRGWDTSSLSIGGTVTVTGKGPSCFSGTRALRNAGCLCT